MKTTSPSELSSAAPYIHARQRGFWHSHAIALQKISTLFGLFLTVPAFYLLLVGRTSRQEVLAHVLFLIAALLLAISLVWRSVKQRQARKNKEMRSIFWLDILIICACLASMFPSSHDWSMAEWILRLGLCVAVVARMVTVFLYQMKLSYIAQVTLFSLTVLNGAAAGFYWLEPSVTHYSEGIWLAFTTMATVGYGDLVPSTPASKVFAVFIVLLGYAVFSIVTANIAALFVSAEEKRLKRDLHHDILSLREEIRHLRQALLENQEKNKHVE